MKKSILEVVKANLDQMKPVEFALVAQKSGVPESTIRKMHYGQVKSPRINTVQALHDYFSKRKAA